MAYHIGIDAGSKTIKIVVCNEEGTLIHSEYKRHRSNIQTTLQEVIHSLAWRHGNIEGSVGITGSAGMDVARMLGVPFYQEVVATTHIVKKVYPQVDVVIELGGEDAKIIYVTDPVEQRMNASCAGGTGGFIDTIAFMLGIRSSQFDQLAIGANRIYPIASRCAVFAQTDVRPLLNAGAKPADIAASVLEAVVNQTLGGLACGRPIEGNVLFLGGPLEHISELVRRFRGALHLNHTTGIKPEDAHLFTARGAALMGAAELSPVVFSLQDLEKNVASLANMPNDVACLEPLFASEAERADFKERHAKNIVPRAKIFEARGNVFLGMDAGSTAIKLAVLDEANNLLYTDYALNEGDTLKIAKKMLLEFYAAAPKDAQGKSYIHVAHATVTGYGEDLLRAAFGFDSGVVETLAHARAAQQVCPDVSFVLDIGGQDMKALWIKDGRVKNAVLNEACSSGCGSFIEGSARSLQATKEKFAELALSAKNPVDLGTKCTVFMTSKVRHAQKIGIETSDIAAGIAYSVVRNALYRIIGLHNVSSLGKHIVVQGGAFMSNAVLRAFEKEIGLPVLRPECARSMGAIGAALVAHERFKNKAASTSLATSRASTKNQTDASTILSLDELNNFSYTRKNETCTGCTNACQISIVEFDCTGKKGQTFGTTIKKDEEQADSSQATSNQATKPQAFISQNKCLRAYDVFKLENAQNEHKRTQAQKLPNTIAYKQAQLGEFRTKEARNNRKGRAEISVGIMNTLGIFEETAFWHSFFRSLGFRVVVPHKINQISAEAKRRGAASVPSESVCYNSKLSHARFYDMLEQGANIVFMPHYVRGGRCIVTGEYALAVRDSIPEIRNNEVVMCMPTFQGKHAKTMMQHPDETASLLKYVNTVLEEAKASLSENEAACVQEISRGEFRQALERGSLAQEDYMDGVVRKNTEALDWAIKNNRKAVLIAGRPYHADADIVHSVDTLLNELGFAVLTFDGVVPRAREVFGNFMHEQHQKMRRGEKTANLWAQGQHLQVLANYVATQPNLEFIMLQSFGCYYDAVSAPYAQEILEDAGKNYTLLKIDEIVDSAHIKIRLRTLAETLELNTLKEESKGMGGAEGSTQAMARGGLQSGDIQAAAQGSTLAVMQTAAQGSTQAATQNTAHTFHMISLEALTDDDVLKARRVGDADNCYVAACMTSALYRLAKENPQATSIEIPNACQQCVLESVPGALRRELKSTCPEIAWTLNWPATDTLQSLQTEVEAENILLSAQLPGIKIPRIGIVGCPLLVFDKAMNNNVIEFIQAHGGEVVLPNPQLLYVEDVRYLRQLEAYQKAGVDHVIYLLSLGCLKGHVRARGAAHELAKTFPNMPITVVDYDNETSELNRQNRILLALSAAKGLNK